MMDMVMMPGDGVRGHENKVYQVTGAESNWGRFVGSLGLAASGWWDWGMKAHGGFVW
jgi:hypothetical protein